MLINRGTDEPGTGMIFDPHTLHPIDSGTKRVGQTRKNRYKTTLQDLWKETTKRVECVNFASALSLDKITHALALRTHAAART